jgi:poly-beta-1,6-N-acetyl-D-glucosamine synthase
MLMPSLFFFNIFFLSSSFLVGFYGLLRFKRMNQSTKGNCILLEEITVIVPFRNEENNLPLLLECLVAQLKRPSRIIFIDDHSEDNGKQIIAESVFNEGLLALPKHRQGKKEAIRFAMEQVKTEFVLTLDADISFKNDFFAQLESLDKKDMLILPVIMKGKSVLGRLFELDYALSHLMNKIATGIKHPILASGANLLYRKEKMISYDTYHSHKQFASGDDVFLLKDFLQNECDVSLVTALKHAVYTKTPRSLFSFFNQRLRWLSKSNEVNLTLGTRFSLFVAIYHAFFAFSVAFLLFTNSMESMVILLIVKVLLEMMLSFHFFFSYKRIWTWILLPFSSLLYPLYIGLLISGSFLLTPKWKGRAIR